MASDRPLQLAVLLSGSGTTLANLITRIREGRLRGVQIARVISSRGSAGGGAIAEQAGLPLEVIERRLFDCEAGFSNALSAALDQIPVDLVAMGGFLSHWRLPERYFGRTLNIHPSLLPDFGGRGMYGLRVHEAVLAAGRTESGCTVHLVDDQYDHGPIIAQRRVPVLAGDDAAALAWRVAAAERELYPEILQQVATHGVSWLRDAALADG